MKVKKDFLNKKIMKYEKKFIEIPLSEETRNGINLFDFSIMLYNLRGKNIIFGDYYFFEDNTHYNIKTLEMYNTLEFYKYIENKWCGRSHEIKDIDYTELVDRFPMALEFKRIDRDYVKDKYYKNALIQTDEYVAKLTRKNKNVIYLRDQKYIKDFVGNPKYKITDIPLENFTFVFSFDITELKDFNTNNSDELIVCEATFKEINKNNCDEYVFKHFGNNETGYVEAKDREGYDFIYNTLFNGKEIMFSVEYKCFFPSHYIEKDFSDFGETMWLENNKNNEMGITQSEPTLYALEKRLSFVCNYFKDLEDYSQIDLRVFEDIPEEKTDKKRKGRVITEIKSTIVKSHIRRYKSGVVSIIRTFVRKGKNSDSRGICVTI
ncbi:hypothetical protein [Cetobacterium sp.]|uniref:hypothetical protein n=1 Tax=Cetobacterium sp. TaxID=2071632 RepID=UPI003F2C2597